MGEGWGTRLGAKQLQLLRFIGTRGALVVGDKASRRLCELGLLQSEEDGSFARITANGLRALADALDAGRIVMWTRPTPSKDKADDRSEGRISGVEPSLTSQSGIAQPHTPRGVQLQRTKGWRMPTNTVKVDRSTQWGNHDYVVGEDGDAEYCVEMFDHDLDKFETFHPEQYRAWIRPLIGKNLGCWCGIEAPCHRSVLLRRAAEAADGSASDRVTADAEPSTGRLDTNNTSPSEEKEETQ